MKLLKSIVSSWMILAIGSPVAAVDARPTILRGRVVAITDGDTLKILDAAHVLTVIRLAEIDAPERRQAYGSAAKQKLASLAYGKSVTATITGVDRYGRSIALVRAGGVYVNAEMVRQGAAWAYRAYLHDRNFLEYERDAKINQRGLWGLSGDHPEAPWLFRSGPKHIYKAFVSPDGTYAEGRRRRFACAEKRYCSQMSSYAEAVFYLRECGASRLDGDHDGKPCERLQ